MFILDRLISVYGGWTRGGEKQSVNGETNQEALAKVLTKDEGILS